MLNMTKIVCILSLLIGHSSAIAGWRNLSVEKQRKSEIKRLEKRKQGFDSYLAAQAKREKARLAVAYKMKAVRKEEALKKEKARRNFRRKYQEFPASDYRKFIKRRDLRIQQNRKNRTEYSKVQKELKKIFESRKYKINGKKEFNL